MATTDPTLYAGLLGPSWEGLPPLVRRLHGEGCATGHFTIRRARGVLAALVGWLCQLPPAGEHVPTRLVVRRQAGGQRWERTFGTHALATGQRVWEGGLLAEQLGPVECVFRLRAERRGLRYEQVGTWLRLGPWSLRLPRWMSPRIEAEAFESAEGMHVHVRIHVAVIGAMLSYEGVILPEEASP